MSLDAYNHGIVGPVLEFEVWERTRNLWLDEDGVIRWRPVELSYDRGRCNFCDSRISRGLTLSHPDHRKATIGLDCARTLLEWAFHTRDGTLASSMVSFLQTSTEGARQGRVQLLLLSLKEAPPEHIQDLLDFAYISRAGRIQIEQVNTILVALGQPKLGDIGSEIAEARRLRRELPNLPPIPEDARCVVCGTTERLTWDHILPRSMGGINDPENLQVMCLRHNLAKGNALVTVGQLVMRDAFERFADVSGMPIPRRVRDKISVSRMIEYYQWRSHQTCPRHPGAGPVIEYGMAPHPSANCVLETFECAIAEARVEGVISGELSPQTPVERTVFDFHEASRLNRARANHNSQMARLPLIRKYLAAGASPIEVQQIFGPMLPEVIEASRSLREPRSNTKAMHEVCQNLARMRSRCKGS